MLPFSCSDVDPSAVSLERGILPFSCFDDRQALLLQGRNRVTVLQLYMPQQVMPHEFLSCRATQAFVLPINAQNQHETHLL